MAFTAVAGSPARTAGSRGEHVVLPERPGESVTVLQPGEVPLETAVENLHHPAVAGRDGGDAKEVPHELAQRHGVGREAGPGVSRVLQLNDAAAGRVKDQVDFAAAEFGCSVLHGQPSGQHVGRLQRERRHSIRTTSSVRRWPRPAWR
jgi:hypothetical protein